ncbi:hypothetical protein ZWY2020_024865 [Hordeum vulgare]|nr:hypothetical protein ZWY2020_024865 [Hordeum vulgare]
MRKQYEAGVTEVHQELEEASLKCEAFEQKAKDEAAEQTKVFVELQSERVERRFFEEEVRQVKLMEIGKTYLLQCAFGGNQFAFLTQIWCSTSAFTSRRVLQMQPSTLLLMTGEQRLFWAQFEAREANPSLRYQMKQLLELHSMVEPVMKDLCVRLWRVETLSSSYFALVPKLIEAAPRTEALERSTCIEGARMAFARTMVHFSGMRPLRMATDPPFARKEHTRLELYFTSAMDGARAIESKCSNDVLLE